MEIKRILPYADGGDLAASREFYVEVFGLEVAMEDPVLGLRSPANHHSVAWMLDFPTDGSSGRGGSTFRRGGPCPLEAPWMPAANSSPSSGHTGQK